MKSFLSFAALLLALSLLTIACQRDVSVNVNQDSIYTEYRLVYDAADDKTYARATFSFGGVGGTNLELSEGPLVFFEGEALAGRAIPAYYERAYAGAMSAGQFAYRDLDGRSFVNEVLLADSIDLPATLDTVPKGAAFPLAWVGAPLTAGEVVIVALNGPNEADAQVFTTEDVGATEIILDRDKLDQVATGTARISIERFRGQLLQDGPAEGGAIWGRYLSSTREVELIE